MTLRHGNGFRIAGPSSLVVLQLSIIKLLQYDWLSGYWRVMNTVTCAMEMHVWDNLEWYSRYVISYMSYQWNTYACGRDHFQNGGCLGTRYAVLRMPPFSQCTSMNRVHRQNKPSAQLPQPTRSQTGKWEEFEIWTPISPGELIRQSPYCPGQGHSQQEDLSAHCSR